MTQTILAIAGKPGLYLLVSRGNKMLIVESIDAEKKRRSVGARDRVTSLNDIAIYTDAEDVPLMQVFAAVKDKEGGAVASIDHKKASKEELFAYMAEVLPNFDRDRVYPTDVKKLIYWYNILVSNGLADFSEEAADSSEPQAE